MTRMQVRLQLGIARGEAARLAVLVRAGMQPPDPGWYRLPGAPRHASPAPVAALFSDIYLFVPYRPAAPLRPPPVQHLSAPCTLAPPIRALTHLG